MTQLRAVLAVKKFPVLLNKPPIVTKKTSTFFICLLTFLAIFSSNICIAEKIEDIKPTPRITIPGLEFSEIELLEKTDAVTGKQNTYLVVPYLGEYIMAMYKYAIVVASILAIFIIIFAGFQWATSGGSPEAIKGAQKKISGAIAGLLLAFLSYFVLYSINPQLVKFDKLEIIYVEGIKLAELLEGQTPGDGGDWEVRHAKVKQVVSIGNYLRETIAEIKYSLLLRPADVYAKLEIFQSLKEITDYYYKTKPEDYAKLNADIGSTSTKLSDEYIQKGACLGWNTTDIYGDTAREQIVKFAEYLKSQDIVSYAFYGRGAPCAQQQPKPWTVDKRCSGENTWGRFDCTPGMKKDINTGPWELEYCLDCSGFLHTIYKCGAQKAVNAKTSILFSCGADDLKKYQPIPPSEATAGDIVGYRADKNFGIPVGHVMLCANTGCTKIIHVHGPQGYKKDNKYKALSDENETYLKILLQEKLEIARAYMAEKNKTKFNKWEKINSLTDKQQNQINSRGSDGESKAIKNGAVILPDEAVAEMQQRTGFKFEYRRIAVADYKDISEIPPPTCENIKQHSVCGDYLKQLQKSGGCK